MDGKVTITAQNNKCVRGGTVGWGTALQDGRSRVRFSMTSLTQTFRSHYGLGSTQPLTEMSTWNTSCVARHPPMGLIALPSSCVDCLEVWKPQPPGTFLAAWTGIFFLQSINTQWLRCCATNRKVAGSIPDDVVGIFHWHNPSDRTMALGSTQPLKEMSTRSISCG
jgi:hypothetical protein